MNISLIQNDRPELMTYVIDDIIWCIGFFVEHCDFIDGEKQANPIYYASHVDLPYGLVSTLQIILEGKCIIVISVPLTCLIFY